MRHSLLHTVGNLVWVARSERRRAVPLLRTYAGLKLAAVVPARGRGRAVSHARILGFDVAFFDHYWLVEMYEEIFLRGQYFFESDRARPVVLDVGSNIGLAILYFKSLHPAAAIVGFEPDREAFELLTMNVRVNGLRDVTLVNAAAHDGRASVVLHGDAEVRGSPRASTSSARSPGAATVVRAQRLSEHVVEEVDLVKLDVEGAERTVLEELDASGKLALVRGIAVEYHHHLDRDEDELSHVLSLLERNGFGYQLDARLAAGSVGRSRIYQNVLVRAYRKESREPLGRRGAPAGVSL